MDTTLTDLPAADLPVTVKQLAYARAWRCGTRRCCPMPRCMTARR